jgi:hypothetical protein
MEVNRKAMRIEVDMPSSRRPTDGCGTLNGRLLSHMLGSN